jgi:hypothetical protein
VHVYNGVSSARLDGRRDGREKVGKTTVNALLVYIYFTKTMACYGVFRYHVLE